MIERGFVAFLIGRVSIWAASVMLSVALGWHIYIETREPFFLALIGLMQILPTFAFFIITGFIIDRIQRKYILLICTLIEFVAFAGIGMITPPVCVGIYTSASVIKENPGKAFKEVPLFTVVGILYGIIMILFPSLSTWLPAYLSG